jgi:hypothetical protein
MLVFIIAVIPRILLLNVYPHISQWDELRDAGYHALRIANNEGSNVFGFGSYQGYGNFVSIATYFCLKLFGQTFLAYTIPATIYGTLTICLLYLIIAKYKGKQFAVIVSTLCSASFTLLIYSRTHVCIITDAFIAVLLFFGFLAARSHKFGYLLLGLIGGLTWHFYAGSRLILLCLIIVLLFYELHGLIKVIKGSALPFAQKVKPILIRYAQIISLGISGLFISLGPTILYLNAKTIFSLHGTTLFIFFNPTFQALDIIGKGKMIMELYLQAFFSYTFIPVHALNIYFSKLPVALLSFPINILFLLGILVIIFRKDWINKVILVVVLLFPLFAEVLPNQIGHSHRLQGIVPFITIVAAVGLDFIFNTVLAVTDPVVNKLKTAVLVIFVLYFYINQVAFFFSSRILDTFYDINKPTDYVFQLALQNIAKSPDDKLYFIVNRTPNDYSYLHYKEKMYYLTSPKKVLIVEQNALANRLAAAKKSGKDAVVIVFRETAKLPSEIAAARNIPLHKVNYTCTQRHFSILYDCPKGANSYAYYYYEINN